MKTTSKLIIFDIDGTLTHTNDVDSVCFSQVITKYLNITNLNTNWHEYKYSTDSGILLEIFQKYANTEPTEVDINYIQEHFIELLKTEFNNHNPCNAIKGANEIINSIQANDKYKIAIATGGWSVSAKLKLDSAKINHAEIPKSYSDSFFERTDIILDAVQQSKNKYTYDFVDITYIGDRLWDYSASQKLGINFVGIGEELREHGHIKSVLDFEEQDKFFELVNGY